LIAFIFTLIFFIHNPGARKNVIRLAQYIPKEIIKLLIKRDISSDNYLAINNKLLMQLKLVKWYSSGPNYLLRGLIENTSYALEFSSTQQVYLLKSYFLELVNSYPEFFPARIWLVNAIKSENIDEAFRHLDEAFRLSGGDDRTYRLAFEMIISNNLKHKASKWCKRYQNNVFGGPRPLYSNSHGVGIRKIVLEIFSNEQKSSQLIMNSGIQLGSINTYKFTFINSMLVNNLKLHLNFVPGISLFIYKLELYNSGKLQLIIENPTMTSTSAVHLLDGRIVTTLRKKETISIHSLNNLPIRVDKINMYIKFDRMELSTPSLCSKF